MTTDITINKSDVMNEVAKLTSYVGAKAMGEDAGAYERVFTADADNEQLETFWQELCDGAGTVLKTWLVSEDRTDGYKVTLSPSLSWPQSLAGSVTGSLRGYFINGIVSRWLMITLPASAEAFARLSATCLAEAERKLWHREKPKRRN